MNYCPNCGTANRDGSRFCNECGHKMPSKTGIMCPMCSHVNPAANVYCDNCQARLVPVSPDAPASTPSPTGGTAPIRKGISLPVKPSEAIEPEGPAPEAEPESEETPDWLVRLRAAAPKPSEAPPESAPAKMDASGPADEIPDWMRPAEDEKPDWFQRLSEPSSSADQSESGNAGEETPDWMQTRDSAAPASASDAGQPPDESAPDWMQLQPESESAGAGDAARLPDWLSTLDAPLSGEGGASTEAADSDLPDWLKDIKSQPPAKAKETPAPRSELVPEVESVEDVPDWLAAMAETPAAAAEEPELEEAPIETPDWLTAVPGETSQQPSAPVELEAEETQAEAPDWLAEIGAAPAAEAPQAEQVPDWLAGLGPKAEPEPSTEEVPDWLLGISSPVAAEEAAAQAELPQEEESLDWLEVLRAESAEPASEAAPSSQAITAFVGEDAELIEPGETPDWLTEAAQPAPPAAEQPAAEVEMPDWLRDLGPMPSAARVEELPFGEAQPVEQGELPEWLRGMQPGQAPPAFADEAGRSLTPEMEEAQGEAELEVAAIPSWLQALRPSEAAGVPIAPEEGVTETEGVLAGLQNVLPAAPFMAQVHGAPAVRRAQVPAADLARAGVFQELLARGALEPTVVKPSQSSRARMRARVGRWLIAAALIAAALAPNWFNFMDRLGIFALDKADAGLYQSAAQQIDALDAGRRVLVAFDYDAYQAGEMEPIAEAVLTHISQRGAQATAVSLNPTGPALASRVFAALQRSGVAETGSVRPLYYAGQSVGAQNALVSTQLGAPVDMIVVLAGSPEAMRWWIEQVAAAGLKTPVVAGVSAGALPQIEPYVQSGQIKGMVNGLMGGLAYRMSITPQRDIGTVGFDSTVRSESLYLIQIVFAAVLVLGLFGSLLAGIRRAS